MTRTTQTFTYHWTGRSGSTPTPIFLLLTLHLMTPFAGGILCLLLGIAFLRYTKPMIDFTGPWHFIEKYAGYGSTPSVMRLVGLILIILGLFLMLGII